MTPSEQEWLERDEKLWREADAIARASGLDTNGVYRVLRNLELSPAERLRKGLDRGRLRLHTG